MTRILFTALATALVLAVSPAAAHDEKPGEMSLSGMGEVAVAPDNATISLGVVTNAKTATEALAENTARLSEVFAVLDGAGIDGKDRQTSNFSINPEWERVRSSTPIEPKIVGYTVRNIVSILVRDLDNLGNVLDAVTRSGANSFQGLRFGVDDPQPHQDAARLAAIADLRRKAELYAQGMGVVLGDVVSFSETGGFTPQPLMMEARAMAADSSPVPIAEGEVTFRATVNVVYALEQ